MENYTYYINGECYVVDLQDIVFEERRLLKINCELINVIHKEHAYKCSLFPDALTYAISEITALIGLKTSRKAQISLISKIANKIMNDNKNLYLYNEHVNQDKIDRITHHCNSVLSDITYIKEILEHIEDIDVHNLMIQVINHIIILSLYKEIINIKHKENIINFKKNSIKKTDIGINLLQNHTEIKDILLDIKTNIEDIIAEDYRDELLQIDINSKNNIFEQSLKDVKSELIKIAHETIKTNYIQLGFKYDPINLYKIIEKDEEFFGESKTINILKEVIKNNTYIYDTDLQEQIFNELVYSLISNSKEHYNQDTKETQLKQTILYTFTSFHYAFHKAVQNISLSTTNNKIQYLDDKNTKIHIKHSVNIAIEFLNKCYENNLIEYEKIYYYSPNTTNKYKGINAMSIKYLEESIQVKNAPLFKVINKMPFKQKPHSWDEKTLNQRLDYIITLNPRIFLNNISISKKVIQIINKLQNQPLTIDFKTLIKSRDKYTNTEVKSLQQIYINKLQKDTQYNETIKHLEKNIDTDKYIKTKWAIEKKIRETATLEYNELKNEIQFYVKAVLYSRLYNALYMSYKMDFRSRIYPYPVSVNHYSSHVIRDSIRFHNQNEQTYKYDATCSVLQILSCICRDKDLAIATNVIKNNESIQLDPYKKILEITSAKFYKNIKDTTIKEDINYLSTNREILKIIIMTGTYGSGVQTMTYKINELVNTNYRKINRKTITEFIKAFHTVLEENFSYYKYIKFMQNYTEVAIKHGHSPEFQTPHIHTYQLYKETKEYTLRTPIINIKGFPQIDDNKTFSTKIPYISSESNTDIKKSRNAIVANTVHSIDANIMFNIIHQFQYCSRPILTIHDCFIIVKEDKNLLYSQYSFELKTAWEKGIFEYFKVDEEIVYKSDLWETYIELKRELYSKPLLKTEELSTHPLKEEI